MRGRTPLIALALAVISLAVWRGACVLAGPDVDTDAYAHHMIARAILADPHDLAVHWVWLPLFHYLQVPLVALGGTMNDVRWANVLLSAALPIVLFTYVRRTSPPEGRALPGDMMALVAALFAAACPIAMQMGTTAQSEPLFALIVLAIAIAYERRRYATTAGLLGVAVLLRYEAWAILALVVAVEGVEEATRRTRTRHGLATEPPSRRRWAIVVVPAALILTWAALRRPVDGRWFGFLGDTHAFASRAAAGADKDGVRGAIGLARDVLYYPVFVAVRVLGPVAVLAAFGIVRTWREQGARFTLVLAACLGFVSLTWVKRSSLGLDRHFVAVVPLYAIFAAQGVAVLAERMGRKSGSAAIDPSVPVAVRAIAAVLALGSLVVLCVMLDIWMGFWRSSIERGWPERTALAAYLRTIPADAPIFCDDATLEILSGLDRHRFDRHWIDDPETWDRVSRAATDRGVAYVATWRRKLAEHEGAGDVVFHASEPPNDPSAGVAVMRVARKPGTNSLPAY